MRSVAITACGGPEVLQLREAPDPAPGQGQVRVRVKAAGVNFADTLMRMGLYPGAPPPPFVPGYEACGVIDALGPGASGWKPGDQVIVPTNFGGYADTLVAQADQVFPLPSGQNFAAGAAFTVNYLTAYEALVEHGHLQKGRRVLIHGAAGGVGVAAVQIARIYGAEIFGTASASKHGFLKELGVRHCIDYRTQDFADEVSRLTQGAGVHVALDPIGGESFKKSYASLAPMGKLILYGFSASATGLRRGWLNLLWQYFSTPRFSAFDLMFSNKGVVGLHLGRLVDQKEHLKESMTRLLEWWSTGRLAPHVGASFKLEEAGKAHELLQSRRSVGKVVLTA